MDKKAFLKISFSLMWILLLIYLASVITPKTPTWPMFFVGIFSSVYAGKKKPWEVIIQGVVGLLCAALFFLAAVKLSGLPEIVSVYVPLTVILGFLLYGCVLLPKFCSLVGFAYFTIACIVPNDLDKLFILVAMTVLGGGLQAAVTTLADKVIDKYIK